MHIRPGLLACLAVCALVPLGAAPGDGPIQLFNGKDLSGWRVVLVEPNVPIERVWSVRDGVLVGTGEPLGYLHTEQSFTSYRLVVEWRWAPGTTVTPDKVPNSGVLMRINGEPKGIPRALEAQLRSGNAGDLYGFWGMKLAGDPQRMRRRSDNPLLGEMTGVTRLGDLERPIGEWNRYDIVLDAGRITVHVNGTKANEAHDAEVLAGPIGLQSEGGEIHFRKVELTPTK
jgi:hypothetical protein